MTALAQLLDDDTAVRATALQHLDQTVHHQNSVYSATVPATRYVAAILADPRTVTAAVYRRDGSVRPLRAVLLDWLGEIAEDVGDDAIAVMGRLGFRIDDSPEILDLRAIRPTVLQAVYDLLEDLDPDVRHTAAIAAIRLLSPNELVHQRVALEPIVRDLLTTSTNRVHRDHAVAALHAWELGHAAATEGSH
jgi:hypothetical protein